MLNIKLEPEEIQFAIQAIHHSTVSGRDAHTVSSLLKKFEAKLEGFKPIQK